MIGLDIGTRFVKAVLLEQQGNSVNVVACACEPISGNAFAEREIKDFDAVSNALRKVKMSLKSKVKEVAVAVSGNAVLSKVVYMEPEQSDFELESQIEIEADSLIPYPLDEVYLDFEELGPSVNHVGKVDVLLSAAHKDMVDTRMTLLREVPFEPKVMDIEVYALANAIVQYAESEEDTIFAANLGATQLQFCVIKDGQVQYQKDINFGLDSLLQDLSMIHTLERTETEQQLISGQLPGNWQQDNLPMFVANLNQHIQRAIQMYVSTTHGQRPNEILLCGGASNFEDISLQLAQELGIDVKVFNPLQNMKVNDKFTEQAKKLGPQLAIACGLASRSFTKWHI